MKYTVLLFILVFFGFAKGQNLPVNAYKQQFDDAYTLFPTIPRGLLEAVAYTNTRFTHLQPDSSAETCTGIPQAYGVMGLYADGKGYFRNTLFDLSAFSDISPDSMFYSPRWAILSCAEVFSIYTKSNKPEDYKTPLGYLSGLPSNTTGQKYAIDLWLYQVYSLLNSAQNAAFYDFPYYSIDMADLFGEDNLKVLSASHVMVSEGSVISKSGVEYVPNQIQSADYGPANWVPAASCNYSSRNGVAVSAVTIHTVQGSYAGCISWFQNCNAGVSAHYVVRSSDGQITQMVLESNKAWHVGSENPYTIGIEHEGYVDNPAWYTPAMYAASAALCRDICNSGYGINPLRTYYGPSCTGGSSACQLGGCIKIKGHQHFANQTHTDPGPNWNWYTFYNLINNNTPVNTITAATGMVYDSGGPTGNYANDEHTQTLISPPNTAAISLTFSQFNLEDDWDYLYVYDGNSINAPLLGTYTGNSLPPVITSTGGALLLRFRSDCATTAAGWVASYTSVSTGDFVAPTTLVNPTNNWYDSSFVTGFTDADNPGGSGLAQRFYTVACYDSTFWNANQRNGFYRDDFDNLDRWTAISGTWALNNGALQQTDEVLGNTNLYSTLDVSSADAFLFHWRGKIDGSGSNRRAGFHYFADSGPLDNHGNSYFVWFRADQDELQIYKVTNNVFSLEATFTMPINTNQWYNCKLSYTKQTGKTMLWVDNVFIGQYVDATPYTTGNYIAFRSGNAAYTVDDFEVYHLRGNTTNISIAQADTTADVWRENPTINQPAGLIHSIVTDNAGNISGMDGQPINVAFTVYWTGAVSTDWNNALNWAPAKVPTQHTNAVIPDVTQQSGNFPLVDNGNNAVAKNLSVLSGASLGNANGKTITVIQNLSNKGTINAGANIKVGP
jgi:N-acetyl-anhydromuramyl-L-alanine amidase AmpD